MAAPCEIFPNSSAASSVPHLSPIKLSSSSYLVWRTHMKLLISLHKFSAHIDGTSTPPAEIVTTNNKTTVNPLYTSWSSDDQKTALLLLSSLTEEAAAEVLGLTTAQQIWTALEQAYSNASVERVQSLRDALRQISKGTSSVGDFSRRFRSVCEQLAAIGHPVAEIDNFHWFLCGLGPSYEVFSTAIRATKPAPVFRDLVTQAESHEMFLQSLHGTTTPSAAFHAQTRRESSTPSRGRGFSSRGSYSRGTTTRGRGNRRPPHCQLCRTTGHYASSCPKLHTFATQAPNIDDDLAKAFHAQCHVHNNTPDWTGDSGATDHIAPDEECLHHSTPYKGSQDTTGSCKREVR